MGSITDVKLLHALSNEAKNLSGFICTDRAVFIETGVQSNVAWTSGVARTRCTPGSANSPLVGCPPVN